MSEEATRLYGYGGESDWDDTDLLLRGEAAARIAAELAAMSLALIEATADEDQIVRLEERIARLEECQARILSRSIYDRRQ